MLLTSLLLGAALGGLCPPGAVRYTVAVEPDLPVDVLAFTASVRHVLEGPGGWGSAGLGELCFDPRRPNFAVLLAWPDTVDEMCSPMETRGDVSCSRNDRAVVNYKRWVNGSSGWATVADYRRYVLTHEVGHVLGMGHKRCPDDWSEPTPVMRQQTSERHASCPRNAVPIAGEVDEMRERLGWRFRQLKRRRISDLWERPAARE